MMALDPRLLAAARVLTGLSQAELAQEAGVHRNALQRIEAGSDVRLSTLTALMDALLRHGVEILDGDEHHVGSVRLRSGTKPG